MKDRLFVYPWLAKPVEQLLSAYNNHRLPHAMLFSGLAGLGKSVLAENFSVCLAASPLNRLWIVPEEGSDAIKIDQIRHLHSFIENTSLYGEKKIVLIRMAEQMNIAASNALLKMLEEPQGDSLLILLTENFESLLPTIVSRCQRLHFSTPSNEEGMSWLASQGQDQSRAELGLSLALGAPLRALEILEAGQDRDFEKFRQDIMAYFSNRKTLVDVSLAWEKYSLPMLLHFLQLIVHSLLKRSELVQNNLFAIYARVLAAKRAIQAKVAINPMLALEQIL